MDPYIHTYTFLYIRTYVQRCGGRPGKLASMSEMRWGRGEQPDISERRGRRWADASCKNPRASARCCVQRTRWCSLLVGPKGARRSLGGGRSYLYIRGHQLLVLPGVIRGGGRGKKEDARRRLAAPQEAVACLFVLFVLFSLLGL